MFKNFTCLVALAATVWVVGAAPVHGAKPTKIDPAEALSILTPKVVFVTGAVFNGNLGGLDGADAKCQTAADVAGLDGEFQAWLSAPLDTPTTRWSTLSLGPYIKSNGQIIAANYADILSGGSINTPIAFTEAGVLAGGSIFVWTGTHQLGFHVAPNCIDWTTSSVVLSGHNGARGTTTSVWTNQGTELCNEKLHLYCFEQ